MKDPSDVIREWVYNALYGTITYNGSIVSVYSFAPKDQSKPYIIIGQQVMTGENGTKDAYITTHEITVEIWTSTTGNRTSYVAANTIADYALQILRRRTLITTGAGGAAIAGITGYNVISCTVNNLITDCFLMENEIIVYKSISIKFELEES